MSDQQRASTLSAESAHSRSGTANAADEQVPVDTMDLEGYPRLAGVMARRSEMTIFRRFEELNFLNLLRLQAEIQNLEGELAELRKEDAEAVEEPARQWYHKDFSVMRDNALEGDSLQLETMIEIGKKLQEYNSAIASFLRINDAAAPHAGDLAVFKDWLNRPDGGNGFLHYREGRVWASEASKSYVTFHHHDLESDMFTSFLRGKVLDLYHILWGQRRKEHDHGLRAYEENNITRASNIISAVLSSVLPTLAILILFFVKRMLIRIGLVIIFTSIFSLTLALVTAARKVEIFSATAAFAAVEVVFIGSTSNGTDS